MGPDDGFERLLRGETPKTPEEQALGQFLQDVGGAFPAEPLLAEEPHLAEIVQAAQLLADKGEPAVRSASKADGVHEIGKPDFEERFLMLDRISNLITTRSDTFTAYIVLQGWRNAGTATPQLVVQRRVAMIIDRNNITGAAGSIHPKVTSVAND